MTIIGALPNNLQNGTTADASQVMADFNFIVNQVNANALPTGSISPGALVNVQVFSASGTYTPTSGANKAIVFAIGAGGGGGGGPATGVNQISAGSGGNAGAFGATFIPSALSSQTVTIGGPGVGQIGTNGTQGGTTSFGTLLTCPGGLGGALGGPSTSFVLPSPGPSALATASGILLINGAGALGAPSIAISTAAFSVLGGNGASSPWGAGGSGATTNGFSASGAGAGGGGSGTLPSSSATTGGTGSGGRVVVYEFA